jgi:hypothetical protein
METLILSNVNPFLQAGNGEVLKTEILRMIMCSCLWHEPHSFKEILEKAEKSFLQWADSKRTLKRCLCSVLRKTIDSGLVTNRSGLFLLTIDGRKTTGKHFGFAE